MSDDEPEPPVDFENFAARYMKTRVVLPDHPPNAGKVKPPPSAPAPPSPAARPVPPLVPVPAAQQKPVSEPGQVVCPHCRALLEADIPLAVGQPVQCCSCGACFAVGAAQPVRLRPAAPPLTVVPDTAGRQGVNWKALLFLLGPLLLLGGAIAGGVYYLSGEPLAGPNPATGQNAAQPNPDHGTEPGQPGIGVPMGRPSQTLAALSPQQQAEVDQAVTRGVTFLKFQQNPNGTWLAINDSLPDNPAGLTALVGLTLLECGVPKTDPAIQRVVTYLKEREASNPKIRNTYGLGLAILFVDRLDDPREKDLIRELALRLVAGQTASGGWSYRCPVLSQADANLLATLLDKSKGDLAADTKASRLILKPADPSKLLPKGHPPLAPHLADLPVWRSNVVLGAEADADNSNTQFAVLGLWAAKTHGVPVQRALARAVTRFHMTQDPDGSWGYEAVGPRKATASNGQPPTAMTCAGLLGLAAGQGLVNEARGHKDLARRPAAQQDPAIQHALDYLGQHIGNPDQPWKNAAAAPSVDLYFLWSVERIGLLLGLPLIGGKDWYGWGAEQFVAHQTVQGAQGFWDNGGYYGQNHTINTCLALLFLKRANLARDLTDKLTLQE